MTVDSLPLTDDVLAQRVWRMPDMVVYQRGPAEWWFAPLDDALPVVSVNRTGADLLSAMDGNMTVKALLDKFGGKVCGTQGETGRWCLEHWSLPRYSLCYFGSEPPMKDRGDARWDLLLLKIREGWSGTTEFEGETDLSDFHTHDIASHEGHFETIETTVSHLFREPSVALGGLTYGRLLAKNLKALGWWTPPPRVVLEVGGGLGYLAREFGRGLFPEDRNAVRYLFVDITKPFLQSQLAIGSQGGWQVSGTQGNAEFLPVKDGSVDLIIDNENLADMTPVKLTRDELLSRRGSTPLHEEALNLIQTYSLSLRADLPTDFIFNLGPLRFLKEAWRVLKPGG
jgi:SAM-dependent methyltransferase